MWFGKIILLLFFIFVQGGIVMATTNNIEYYRKSYIHNYRHPFVFEERIEKDDVSKLNIYFIVQRDEKGRIVFSKQIIDNKCVSHFIYSYKADNELAYFIVDEICDLPFEQSGLSALDEKTDKCELEETLEYYKKIVDNNELRLPEGQDRITKENAEKLKNYFIIQKDKKGRVVSVNKIYDDSFLWFAKKKRIVHETYAYRKDGRPAYFKVEEYYE
jgi:hypothetical protein